MRARRYPSDTTDAEWAVIASLLPVPASSTPSGGRPEKHPRREIVDAIRYLVDNGCKWRALPADFPPFQTVYGFYRRWAAAGVITAIRDRLRQAVRERLGRCPNPVTIIIDSQSVKAAETVSADTRGYDAGKKINGRKRHVVVDTKGMIVAVMVTPANVTDRDAAREVLLRLCLEHPEITQVWADQGYSGELVTWAKDTLGLMLRISKRPPGQIGFKVLPRRWIVERSLSWITQARRLVRDYERLPRHSEALVSWTAITLMTRRLTRATAQSA
jgi:transposase